MSFKVLKLKQLRADLVSRVLNTDEVIDKLHVLLKDEPYEYKRLTETFWDSAEVDAMFAMWTQQPEYYDLYDLVNYIEFANPQLKWHMTNDTCDDVYITENVIEYINELIRKEEMAMNAKKLQATLNAQLEDDTTPYGGIAFVGETLADFIAETDLQPLWQKLVSAVNQLKCHPYCDTQVKRDAKRSAKVINDALIECGICPVLVEEY